jgi:hypothetical protein
VAARVVIQQAKQGLLEVQTQAVAAAVVRVVVVRVVQAALALSSFAIQLHTLMQLHTHPLPKQHQMGTQFIPSFLLEQSPSKE